MDAASDDVFIDEISFPATDGYALTGTLFLPRGTKRVYAFMNFVGVPLVHTLGYAPGWAGIGEDLPKGVPAMGRIGLEPALSLRFKAAGAGEFRQVQGRAARAVLLRRSLGDTARGRAADQRLHRDQAGGADGETVRRRRQGDRPFRLLPPRTPRHAVARSCGVDSGGVIVTQSQPAI